MKIGFFIMLIDKQNTCKKQKCPIIVKNMQGETK
jgi:hypothetical protein